MKQALKKEIRNHYHATFARKRFIPGKTPVPVSGKVFDEKELINGVEAIMDGWWTEGRFAQQFEKEFCAYLGIRYVTLVNSGSSANLIALLALTSTSLGDRALRPGDEVITAASGFPTTVNPIIQNRCTPVFVDCDIYTKNPNLNSIKKALSKKTKAIMLAHTLGNPLPLDGIIELVKKHNLWFIEDCCDALGSIYQGQKTGTFGHIATFSFYPAHQITMGEGGAAVTNHPLLHRGLRQFRDWGRDCWCNTGCDNTCRKRFGWKMGDLPLGYDHKYIYSQIGYNLKLTDMQAAIGLAQLKKLPQFIKRRKRNFAQLHRFFKQYEKFFILNTWEKSSDPCWFGFMLVVKDSAPFTKIAFVEYLEKSKIATRSLFGGNLSKQPAFLRHESIRISGDLHNCDRVMNNGFWIGVYPGLDKDHLTYVMHTIELFLSSYRKKP